MTSWMNVWRMAGTSVDRQHQSMTRYPTHYNGNVLIPRAGFPTLSQLDHCNWSQYCHASCLFFVALGCLVHHRHCFSLSLSDCSEARPPTDASGNDVIDTTGEYNKRTRRYVLLRHNVKSGMRLRWLIWNYWYIIMTMILILIQRHTLTPVNASATLIMLFLAYELADDSSGPRIFAQRAFFVYWQGH